MALSKEEKAALVAQFGKNDKDTGSSAVQIAILTKEIEQLNEHLSYHIHDFASRRGLLMKVGQRKALLKYLLKEDQKGYIACVEALGLRH